MYSSDAEKRLDYFLSTGISRLPADLGSPESQQSQTVGTGAFTEGLSSSATGNVNFKFQPSPAGSPEGQQSNTEYSSAQTQIKPVQIIATSEMHAPSATLRKDRELSNNFQFRKFHPPASRKQTEQPSIPKPHKNVLTTVAEQFPSLTDDLRFGRNEWQNIQEVIRLGIAALAQKQDAITRVVNALEANNRGPVDPLQVEAQANMLVALESDLERKTRDCADACEARISSLEQQLAVKANAAELREGLNGKADWKAMEQQVHERVDWTTFQDQVAVKVAFQEKLEILETRLEEERNERQRLSSEVVSLSRQLSTQNAELDSCMRATANTEISVTRVLNNFEKMQQDLEWGKKEWAEATIVTSEQMRVLTQSAQDRIREEVDRQEGKLRDSREEADRKLSGLQEQIDQVRRNYQDRREELQADALESLRSTMDRQNYQEETHNQEAREVRERLSLLELQSGELKARLQLDEERQDHDPIALRAQVVRLSGAVEKLEYELDWGKKQWAETTVSTNENIKIITDKAQLQLSQEIDRLWSRVRDVEADVAVRASQVNTDSQHGISALQTQLDSLRRVLQDHKLELGGEAMESLRALTERQDFTEQSWNQESEQVRNRLEMTELHAAELRARLEEAENSGRFGNDALRVVEAKMGEVNRQIEDLGLVADHIKQLRKKQDSLQQGQNGDIQQLRARVDKVFANVDAWKMDVDERLRDTPTSRAVACWLAEKADLVAMTDWLARKADIDEVYAHLQVNASKPPAQPIVVHQNDRHFGESKILEDVMAGQRALQESLAQETQARQHLVTHVQLRESLMHEAKERNEALDMHQGQLDVIMKALNWL